MRFTFRLLAVVVAAVGVVGSANATPVVIDSFMNPAVPTSNPFPISNLNLGAPTGDLPATRTITLSPALTNALGNGAEVGGGALAVVTGSELGQNAVQTTLTYSFIGGPLDFSGLTELLLDFSFTDGGVDVGLPVAVEFLTTSGLAVALPVVPDSGVPQTVTLLPADFTNFSFLGGVTGLRLIFNDKVPPQAGADFALTRIRADGNGGIFGDPDPVPEPASIVVFGVLALGGAFVARRKLLAKKAAVA